MIKIKSQPNPPFTISREGFEFELSELSWRLSRDRVLSLSWIGNELEDQLLDSYLKVLLFYAESYSASHTVNLNNHFRRFIQFCAKKNKPIALITSAQVISYRSSLSAKHEYYLGVLSGFYKRWVDLGYAGISPDTLTALSEIRLKGNEKGKAIQISCPYEGALSDLEYERLYQELTDAFEMDKVNLEAYTLIMLCIATGRRPVQLGDLKICDFTEVAASDGQRIFLLRIPRCKQRGTLWREKFRDYALTPELGVLLKSHIHSIEIKFRKKVKNSIGTKNLAIFPYWKQVNSNCSLKGKELESAVQGEMFHRRSSHISGLLKITIKNLNIYSERTGKLLDVFPLRLRRTLATRAAREGYGVLTIAELLDHSDTQSAVVYTQNVPEHVDAINRAVAEQLAPIAQAFAGVLIDHEREAKRGNDLSSRVRSDSSGDGVGSCGHYGFCNALAPIACYTCRNFQPWLDAPHEEVLEGLLARREDIIKKTNDLTMAAVNDRVIFAVTEVIQLCKKRKQKQLEG